MPDYAMRTPVVFIIFNRPDTTYKVFEEIRKAKPPKLMIIADGPRENREDEVEKCAATRAIAEQVDWDCEVLKNYADVNMGCKNRVASGLDWVFSLVEEAIILEDDCLPHSTFFRYCEELLEKYRYDERINLISGDNFFEERHQQQYSYYFSKYTHIWGWASWRRVWNQYDVNMLLWPHVIANNDLENIFSTEQEIEYWKGKFQDIYDGKIDTWDYQLAFLSLVQNRLSILPNVNLVSNIGFREDATHTKAENSNLANLPCQEMIFPLKHAEYMIRDTKSDLYTMRSYYRIQPSLGSNIDLLKIINKKILIWGTGSAAQDLYENLCKCGMRDILIGFIDNNPSKWFQEFNGQKIYPPSDISSITDSFLVTIGSMYYSEIGTELEQLGFKKISNIIYCNF